MRDIPNSEEERASSGCTVTGMLWFDMADSVEIRDYSRPYEDAKHTEEWFQRHPEDAEEHGVFVRGMPYHTYITLKKRFPLGRMGASFCVNPPEEVPAPVNENAAAMGAITYSGEIRLRPEHGAETFKEMLGDHLLEVARLEWSKHYPEEQGDMIFFVQGVPVDVYAKACEIFGKNLYAPYLRANLEDPLDSL